MITATTSSAYAIGSSTENRRKRLRTRFRQQFRSDLGLAATGNGANARSDGDKLRGIELMRAIVHHKHCLQRLHVAGPQLGDSEYFGLGQMRTLSNCAYRADRDYYFTARSLLAYHMMIAIHLRMGKTLFNTLTSIETP